MSKQLFLVLLTFAWSVARAEVHIWDPSSSPLEQGWRSCSPTATSEFSYESGVFNINSMGTRDASCIDFDPAPFDEFVFEFSVRLQDYRSDFSGVLGGCWWEPSVSGPVNNRAVQFRPLFCGSSSDAYNKNNGGSDFVVNTTPHNDAFHVIRYEGSLSSGTVKLFRDGIQLVDATMVVQPSTYPYKTFRFRLGESTTKADANIDINGICVATNGDDCSLETPNKEIPVDVVVNPHDQRCTKGKNRPVGIEVSIRGSEELDVATIDYSTISAGGLELDGEGLSDGACILEYVDDDEFVDATCRFRTGDIPMNFSGSTLDGDTLVGEGAVCLK